MDVVDISLVKLREVPWNPNVMGDHMLARLRESITRFGLIENLVVRAIGRGEYEVLSGNQRFHVLRESGATSAPCVVVDLDDAHARLLAQALNRIQGEDNLGLKAELVRQVLDSLPEQEVLDLLPETAETLQTLANLGTADLAENLQAWEQARAARLQHMIFQLSHEQVEVVMEALERVMAGVTKDGSNPNRRGNALYELCRDYLERRNLS